MLSCRGILKKFGGVLAVDGVSLEISPGRITALIGPNGAGKTTLFNIFSGTTEPDAGTVSLNGTSLTYLPPEDRARKGLSRTFQLPRPFLNLTVAEHIELALRQDDDGWLSMWKRGGALDVEPWTKRVGLDVAPEMPAMELSYGQGKLLALAMAMAHPHEVLLLDEPVAGVNPVLRERIAQLLRDLRQSGETQLVIEHDMGFILPLADHVVVLDRGRVIASGAPEDVKRDPAVLNAYLGEQL